MLNDKLLIKEIRSGNRRVFEQFFHDYYASLVNFANQYVLDKHTAEDVVQSVFSYFWENSENIEIQQSIQAYLFSATKHACLNYLRKLKIRDRYQILYIEAILKTDENQMRNEEIVESVKLAMKKLPQQMRDIFFKKYFQDLTIKEIAAEMSLSENTVKVQLHRGRLNIKNIVKRATGIFIIF